MSRVLGFLTLCVALAVLKAALAVLVAVGAALLLYALIARPAPTVAGIATLGLVGVANARPLAFLLTAGAITLAVLVAAARGRAEADRLPAPAPSIRRSRRGP